MSLTRSQLEQLHDDRPRRVRLGEPGRRPPVRRWLTEPGAVPGRWPGGLGVAWLVVFSAAIALEPAPAEAGASEPVWATVLFIALLAALAATWVGLAGRQRAGLVASAAAAGLALFGSAMCPVSDHHSTVGAWWYVQMGGFTGLVAASVAGLRRARPGTSAAPAGD